MQSEVLARNDESDLGGMHLPAAGYATSSKVWGWSRNKGRSCVEFQLL